MVYDSEYDLVSWASRRSVAEDVTGVSNSSLILAQDRTYRKDPSDGFKYYKRGWNISEEHYIYVSFTSFIFPHLMPVLINMYTTAYLIFST